MPRMKLHRALLVLGCLLAAVLPVRTLRGETLAFSDCELRAPLGAGVVAARCAGVTVPENYAEQAGPTIALRVAVVKAAEPRAGAVAGARLQPPERTFNPYRAPTRPSSIRIFRRTS